MAERIRVFLVDDHAIVRQGMIALLETHPDLEVIGEAADGVEAVRLALALNPDVILMDLNMPRKNGISAMRDIIHLRPEARILMLSSFSDEDQVTEAINAGAMGYLLKTAKLTDLVDGIRDVYERNMPLNPVVARKLVQKMGTPQGKYRLTEVLTKREIEILPYLAAGISNKEIADRLGISTRTVGTHISNMIRKTEAGNRVQLANLANQQGLATGHQED